MSVKKETYSETLDRQRKELIDSLTPLELVHIATWYFYRRWDEPGAKDSRKNLGKLIMKLEPILSSKQATTTKGKA